MTRWMASVVPAVVWVVGGCVGSDKRDGEDSGAAPVAPDSGGAGAGEDGAAGADGGAEADGGGGDGGDAGDAGDGGGVGDAGDDGGEPDGGLAGLDTAALVIEHDASADGDALWMAKAAGDLTGDGVADLLLAELDLPGGMALVFDGTRRGRVPLDAADARIARASGDRMGMPAIGTGDMTGDGHPDLFIAGHRDRSEGFLLPGPLEGELDPDTDGMALPSATDSARYLDGLGHHDWTGDGVADLLLVEGSVLSGTGVIIVEGPLTEPRSLGADVVHWEPHTSLLPDLTAAGDLNGDGVEDLAMGRLDLSPDWGRVEVAFGPFPDGVTPDSVDVELFNNLGPGRLGQPVRGVGDLDGDGLDDVAAGAPGLAAEGLDEGEGTVLVLPGGTTGRVLATALPRVVGPHDYAQVGRSLAGLADRDGDGRTELLVGSPGLTGDGEDEHALGGIWLVHGPVEGVVVLGDTDSGARNSVLEGSASDVRLGTVLSQVGDTDGDGRSDVFVGADGALGLTGWLMVGW